eukprot:jgi/Mesvir1/28150/Mv04715-RA.1
MHYEGDSSGFTHIAKCGDASRTIQQLKEEFVLAYNRKHPGKSDLQISGVNITNDKQRVLPSSGLVVKLLSDKEDVFVVRDVRAEATPSNQAKPQASLGGASKAKPSPETQAMVTKLVAFASEAQAQRNYLNATKILENVLSLDPTNRDALRGLAVMAAASGKHQLAVDRFRAALKVYPDSPFLHKSLGDALLALKQYQDALLAYDTALGLVDPEEEAEAEREHQRKLKRGEPAPSPSPEAGASSKDIKLASVMSLHEMGQSGLAGQILMPILEADKTDPGSLLAYATILFSKGKHREALGVFLHLLVARPSDKTIRSKLTECLRVPGGVSMLYEEISGGNAPALAFIANVVKDHGGVDEAAVLFKQAVALEPNNASYVLNYVHTLESCNKQDEAIAATLDYCRRAGDVTLARGLFRVSSVVPIVEATLAAKVEGAPFHLRYFSAETGGPAFAGDGALPASRGSSGQGGGAASSGAREEEQGSPMSVSADLPTEAGGVAAGGSINTEAPSGMAAGSGTSSAVEKPSGPTGPSGSSGSGGSSGSSVPGSVEYSETDLDVLALCATLVKLLFFNGAVSAARQLASLLEPVRAASSKPLHTTIIRNEIAYFSCIHQLLSDYPLPPPHITPPGTAPPLFVAGDSHSTSPGWRSLSLRGQARRLVPVIVTGLKMWHLREESRFYPKMGFQNAMAALPDGAQVVMLFGEIDCREGLLVAVERCIYETVEEGMRVTIGIYLRVLSRLIRERGFEIWVHPVLPVLKETAHIVAPFNALLREMVTDAMRGQPRLHWLEFVGELVTGAGVLQASLQLDGTHINPAYLTHVQRGLDEAS